jgi:hypothetical protein
MPFLRKKPEEAPGSRARQQGVGLGHPELSPFGKTAEYPGYKNPKQAARGGTRRSVVKKRGKEAVVSKLEQPTRADKAALKKAAEKAEEALQRQADEQAEREAKKDAAARAREAKKAQARVNLKQKQAARKQAEKDKKEAQKQARKRR